MFKKKRGYDRIVFLFPALVGKTALLLKFENLATRKTVMLSVG